ncbi:hypothetical protein Tsubulata_005946 [Turnera subulata]|uniref:TF-B3 domain-containing protein n=1 Tax=Turnera subulata TaxID=218843 RepID=A0A9Q0IYC5_9ROSI|nr:hypothetical protein Tsubulata_005946 [Turnera subulata]
MEFGSGFSSEEKQKSSSSSRGKLPYSYSPSCSSPSSSSSLVQIYQEKQSQQQMGYWLGNKYDPEEELGVGKQEKEDEVMEVMMREDNNNNKELELGGGGGGVGGRGESSSSSGGGGGGGAVQVVMIEKEHMFDKVVTPSDVGKLNRLVIPKQHAEKYFPLDSSANEKGLLLNFEDRGGKPWRFRYSYWNSSQSYVMTKGWSRFVKEKKLDAGDVVTFQRGVGELAKDRLYIDWRRRPPPDSSSNIPSSSSSSSSHHHYHYQHQQPHPHQFISSSIHMPAWSPLLMRPPAVALLPRDHLHSPNYPNTRNITNPFFFGGGGGVYNGFGFGNHSGNIYPSSPGSVLYMRSISSPASSGAPATAAAPQEQQLGMVQWEVGESGNVVEPMVYESVPVVQGKAAAKRLRLFGVNMDCPITQEAVEEECHNLSSTTTTPTSIPTAFQASHHQYHHQYSPHPLQFRLYKGTPLHPIPPQTNSSMSLDLDISDSSP